MSTINTIYDKYYITLNNDISNNNMETTDTVDTVDNTATIETIVSIDNKYINIIKLPNNNNFGMFILF